MFPNANQLNTIYVFFLVDTVRHLWHALIMEDGNAGDTEMAYIIRAEIKALNRSGMFARDWFDCGINDASQEYETEAAALSAAREAYKGPDVDGVGCRFWAEPTA